MAIDEGFRDKNPNLKICVVLCGRSFIGRSLVQMILKSTDWIVRIADSSNSLVLDVHEQNSILSESISTGRASYFQVDVLEKLQICEAIKGSSVVFHMDASDPLVRDFYHQYMFTVQGTKNVIHACQECKVKRLIYNSSADVVFDGIHDIHDGDESLPYPWRFEDMLSDLKAQAESLVLFANTNDDGLLTCALRPSNAFGPGDMHFVPFIVGEAKFGWAKFIVGDGKNMCDFTYVDNVAHAHICAEKALDTAIASVAGKAVFITNLEPTKMWDFVSHLLEGLGYPRPKIRIPARLVLLIFVLVEWVHEKLGSHRNGSVRRITPAIIHLLSGTRTFNCSQAQKNIGYSPIVSMEEGVELTIESFSHLAEDSPYSGYREFSEPSKVHKLLGRGRAADIILWRDEKETFAYFLSSFFLFYWFFLSGRTFISSTATLVLLVTVILFGHRFLPSSVFGFTIEKISSSYFEKSETAVKDAFICLASVWNRGVCALRLLAQGDDWNHFFKVAGSLYFLKLLISFSFSMLLAVGLVFMFSAFFIYEQHEKEVDRLTRTSIDGIKKLMDLLMRKLHLILAPYVQKEKGSHQKH